MTQMQTVFTEQPGGILFAIWSHYLRTGCWPKALLVPSRAQKDLLFEGVEVLRDTELLESAWLVTFPFYGHHPGYLLMVKVPPVSAMHPPLTRCRLVDTVPKWP